MLNTGMQVGKEHDAMTDVLGHKGTHNMGKTSSNW